MVLPSLERANYTTGPINPMTLPFTSEEVEKLTSPTPVIRLNALKPTPVRGKRLQGIDRLVRDASKYCIKDNREFCMNIARQVLLIVAPSEVARVLKEAVNAGVQYEVALAYIAHALKAGCTVTAPEDAGDKPCIVYRGVLMINTKPLIDGAYTLREASSEFGPIVQSSQRRSLLERIAGMLRGWRA
jgi:hypothetical protein